MIHGSWVQAEIRRHAKADRKTAEAAKVQVKKAETKSLINYYGVNQKPLQPRPLGEADFFIAAPIPATRTDEAEGDEKWRMPKDSKPAGKILGTGLGKGASRGKIKIVNGIRLKKDGTPYKKMGRKPNHSRTVKPNNSSGTLTGEIVEVKVEEITNDDVPLDCLPMEEDEPEEEIKEGQSVEAATTVKVEDIIEGTPQPLLQPVPPPTPPPPSTVMENVVQVQLLPKLVAIQPRVQQKAADVDLQNALQHQIALLTKENTKLTCNNLSLQVHIQLLLDSILILNLKEDLGKMIKFVYQNKGSVNCILCRGEKMKSETYSREQLNSHLAECHSEKETSSLEVNFNHIKKKFEYHVFHHC